MRESPSSGRTLIRILAFSVVHFLVATGVAILTYGTDLDQLRSRSTVSRVSGVVYDIVWYPHDAIIRAIPNATLIRPGVIPSVLVGASLLWGCAAWLLLAAVGRFRRARRESPEPSRF